MKRFALPIAILKNEPDLCLKHAKTCWRLRKTFAPAETLSWIWLFRRAGMMP